MVTTGQVFLITIHQCINPGCHSNNTEYHDLHGDIEILNCPEKQKEGSQILIGPRPREENTQCIESLSRFLLCFMPVNSYACMVLDRGKKILNVSKALDGWLRMGLLPPPREFCRHILSCRELKAESFKRCLHSVLRGLSL